MQPLVKPAISNGPEQAGRRLVRPGQQDLPLDGVAALRGVEERRELFGLGREQRWQFGESLGPDIGDGLPLIEQAQGGDQHQPPNRGVRKGCDLGAERASHRGADEIGAFESALFEQIEGGADPVGDVVEAIVPGGAGKAREGGGHHQAALRQSVEERRPAG